MDVCSKRERDIEVEHLDVQNHLSGENVIFTKFKLGKKNICYVLTRPWLWWRDPITPLPQLVTHSPVIAGFTIRSWTRLRGWAMGAVSSPAPLPCSCRLIPPTGPALLPPPIQNERMMRHRRKSLIQLRFQVRNKSVSTDKHIIRKWPPTSIDSSGSNSLHVFTCWAEHLKRLCRSVVDI